MKVLFIKMDGNNEDDEDYAIDVKKTSE